MLLLLDALLQTPTRQFVRNPLAKRQLQTGLIPALDVLRGGTRCLFLCLWNSDSCLVQPEACRQVFNHLCSGPFSCRHIACRLSFVISRPQSTASPLPSISGTSSLFFLYLRSVVHPHLYIFYLKNLPSFLLSLACSKDVHLHLPGARLGCHQLEKLSSSVNTLVSLKLSMPIGKPLALQCWYIPTQVLSEP